MASKNSKSTKAAAQHRASLTINRPDPHGASMSIPNPGAHTGTLQITGRATGPTQASGTLAPAKPAAPAAPAAPADTTVQPFLTDPQKASLAAWNTKYSDTLAQLNENDTLADNTLTQSTAADEFANANNVDMANQAMAARGLFQSSIRDNALNDLAVTLAQQKIALQATHDATRFTDLNQRTTLGGENDAQQMIYKTDAVANAQGVTPTPPAAAPSATGAVHPAAPPKPPSLGPANGIGPPGREFGRPMNLITNPKPKTPTGPYAASLTRVKSVNTPKPPGITNSIGVKVRI